MTSIKLKRVYIEPDKNDGYRILIDRLWPRGIKKEDLIIDWWDKDIAPSSELREWFHSDQLQNWDEFVIRYRLELHNSSAFSDLVNRIKDKDIVTLLYGAKDTLHNQAVILKEELEKMLN